MGRLLLRTQVVVSIDTIPRTKHAEFRGLARTLWSTSKQEYATVIPMASGVYSVNEQLAVVTLYNNNCARLVRCRLGRNLEFA